MKTVYLASPFRGDYKRNQKFARKALRYAILQNTIPLAPHLLYPQVLDDNSPRERKLGLRLGLALIPLCDEVWVMGSTITEGMRGEITTAKDLRIPIRFIKAVG